jgi:plastocyanin
MLLACCGLELTLSITAVAATTTNVTVGDIFFSPPTVKISPGDSVKWNWTGFASHSSTSRSSPALWDSGVHQSGFSFTHTFASSGTNSYWCTVHTLSQLGTVIVQAPVNVPPTVAITSPTSGATFAAPWTGVVQANVSDSDDTVSKVDFFAGTTPLGTVANPAAQVNFTVTNLAAGTYALKAVATDSRGATNTSASVSISVLTPSPIVLSSGQRLSTSSFQFAYSADPGLSYVVQRSSGLPNWIPLKTNKAASTSEVFLDNNATGDFNFYSIALLPNP